MNSVNFPFVFVFAFSKIALHEAQSELIWSVFSVKHMMHFISFLVHSNVI